MNVFDDGSAHSVGVSISEDEVRFYLDGSLFGSVEVFGVMGLGSEARTCGGSGVTVIGGVSGDGSVGSVFDGSIEGVAVHNFTLREEDLRFYECGSELVDGRTQYTGRLVVDGDTPVLDGNVVCEISDFQDSADEARVKFKDIPVTLQMAS